MEKIYNVQIAITRILMLTAGWAMFGYSFLVTFNVIARKVFSFTLQGIDEYGGYALAIAASIGFSQAVIERAHIRIDILTKNLPIALRSLFDVAAVVTLAVIVGYLTMNAYDVAKSSYEMGAMATSVLRTPLSMPQGAWVVALGWCALLLIVQSLLAISAVCRRDWPSIIRRFGVPSVEEEVEREVGLTAQRLRHAQGAEPKC